MISIWLGAALGAVIGAAIMGTASASMGDITGLGVALSHIPPQSHGYTVVSAVFDALTGGATGGGIGAAVATAAKALIVR